MRVKYDMGKRWSMYLVNLYQFIFDELGFFLIHLLHMHIQKNG
jgi:hypothetical protein